MDRERITSLTSDDSSQDERLRNVLGSYDNDEEAPIINGIRDDLSGIFTNDLFLEEPEAVALATYDDFHTIDWVRDRQRDQVRHRRMKRLKKGSLWDRVKQANDAWAGWLVVFLVGLAAGLCAGVIDIGASWMTDLKLGVCPGNLWFGEETCCWSDDNTYDEEGCQQWHTWAVIFNVHGGGAGAYAINYVMYVLIAMVFSSVAVLLVRWFAPYACGSGIPEVLLNHVAHLINSKPLSQSCAIFSRLR